MPVHIRIYIHLSLSSAHDWLEKKRFLCAASHICRLTFRLDDGQMFMRSHYVWPPQSVFNAARLHSNDPRSFDQLWRGCLAACETLDESTSFDLVVITDTLTAFWQPSLRTIRNAGPARNESWSLLSFLYIAKSSFDLPSWLIDMRGALSKAAHFRLATRCREQRVVI